jgi:hypothetical protein
MLEHGFSAQSKVQKISEQHPSPGRGRRSRSPWGPSGRSGALTAFPVIFPRHTVST